MKWSFIPAIATIVALALSSCGEKNRFTVEAKINGVGTQNLTAIWRSAPDGALSVREVTAVGNQFSFDGNADGPALIEIYTGQGTVLLRLMAAGGDRVRLSGSGSDPNVSGSEIGERFAEALARIHEDPDANASIKSYIEANPADLVSAALLVSEFDTRGNGPLADSLFNSIDSLARPGWLTADWISTLTLTEAALRNDSIGELRAFLTDADTIATVSGAHRYVFTIDASQRTARVLDSLRSWAAEKDAPELLDVYLGHDRISWRAVIEGDSAEWTRMMVPGGPAVIAPLAAMKLPVSVTTDSTGRIISVCPLSDQER
ncbi:MAG: hypothetical protein K2L32_06465 [Muribaculaceae bacterium]|nr:hypothetical protein [Muribaculaceae bacterium]